MAQKASKKLIAISDKWAHRFTSEKSEFGDAEYATSDDNHDLIIDELHYVNTKIANVLGKHIREPLSYIPKSKSAKKSSRAKPKKSTNFRTGTTSLKKQHQETTATENMAHIIKPKTK